MNEYETFKQIQRGEALYGKEKFTTMRDVVRKGEERGLVVVMLDEEEARCYEPDEWDGEVPAHVLWLAVYRSEDVSDGYVKRGREAHWLDSLGMVGVNDMSDPYLVDCSMSLMCEALAVLDREDHDAANTLAERATFAGVQS